MTRFCHADKPSLGFSIYTVRTVCVCVCMFLSLEGLEDGIAFGQWQQRRLHIQFLSRDADGGEQLSSGAAPRQSAVVLTKEALVLKSLHNKEPPLFHRLLS